MVTLHRSLMYLKEAVVKVQGKTIDILTGVSIARISCDELKKVREDIDGYCIILQSCSSFFFHLYGQPEHFASDHFLQS